MDSHRASLSTQIFYGSGSISVGIKNNLLGTYLLIYYNQVLGLDAGIAALAMAIALAVDAVSDPLVGIWSDRIRTRWGRRHPFMYAALLPFAGSYYLLLADPGDISDQSLFARLLVLLIILRLSMTFMRCHEERSRPSYPRIITKGTRYPHGPWHLAGLEGRASLLWRIFIFWIRLSTKRVTKLSPFGVVLEYSLAGWSRVLGLIETFPISTRPSHARCIIGPFYARQEKRWPIDHGSYCS